MDPSTVQFSYAQYVQPQYAYMMPQPEPKIVPTPGSKMAKYKTSLCKHFEQTGTCQMEQRCHFAHGKHELRKQTEALPSHAFELYQTPINTVAPPGYVHNKYKTVPCKNFQTEGHCKYGDRCTFAHGEQDMRAKFVPAELLYPSAGQAPPSDLTQLPPSQYGAVDYAAFSQPTPTVAAASYGSPKYPNETSQMDVSDYESDFNIPSFDPAQIVEDIDSVPFLNSFSYKDPEPVKQNKSVPSSSTKDSPPDSGAPKEVSKFGFGYEALSDNLDELELTSNSKEVIEKFSQAKYQIEMGNIEEGNEILNDMMNNDEVKYREYSHLENHIMSTFAPISE